MALQSADILYLRNSTTVDTGTGIDIRWLDDANAGVADQTQTFTFTHTQDNIERTFDPATAAGATNTNNAGTTLFKAGWALKLADDMTPTDDTNCNAYLPAGTLTVNVYNRSNQTGGTYIGGTFQPTIRASLWRYNPSTDTGTLIAAGSDNTQTWAPSGAQNNVFKTCAVPITIAAGVEFAAGEILYLQIGMNSGTVPNPTLGTGTWTQTLEVDTNNTNISWDTGTSQNISQVCFITGTASSTSTAAGVLAPVYPTTGTASGSSTALGVLEADLETTGTAAGTSDATGAFGAVAETIGTASGVGSATGAASLVVPTVGTVEIGAAGSEPVIENPAYVLTTDGQLEKFVADTSPYPLYIKL